jgi:hypothetical protein
MYGNFDPLDVGLSRDCRKLLLPVLRRIVPTHLPEKLHPLATLGRDAVN